MRLAALISTAAFAAAAVDSRIEIDNDAVRVVRLTRTRRLPPKLAVFLDRDPVHWNRGVRAYQNPSVQPPMMVLIQLKGEQPAHPAGPLPLDPKHV